MDGFRHLVKRQYQQLSERVGIHIERRVEEMGSTHSSYLLLFAQFHSNRPTYIAARRAKYRQTARGIAPRPPAAVGVTAAQIGKARLAEIRWQKPPRSSRRKAQACPSGSHNYVFKYKHLAKGRRQLCQRQGAVKVEVSLSRLREAWTPRPSSWASVITSSILLR